MDIEEKEEVLHSGFCEQNFVFYWGYDFNICIWPICAIDDNDLPKMCVNSAYTLREKSMISWFNWLVGKKRYLQFTNQPYIQSYVTPRNDIQMMQYKSQKLFDYWLFILYHLHQNYVNTKLSSILVLQQDLLNETISVCRLIHFCTFYSGVWV